MQLSDVVRTFLEERIGVLATVNANGSPHVFDSEERVSLKLHDDHADVHGFDGEE